MTASEQEPLRAPFDRIFGNLEQAERFRPIFAFVLERLAIEDPNNPLLTVSLRGNRLHVSYGMWLMLSARGSSTGLKQVGFTMFSDQTTIAFPSGTSGAFARQSADEPEAKMIYVSATGFADLVSSRSQGFEAEYGEALDHVRHKFQARGGTPWRRAHIAEVVTAARSAERWRQLMHAGHVRNAATGYWWVNQGQSYELERNASVIWAPSAMAGKP